MGTLSQADLPEGIRLRASGDPLEWIIEEPEALAGRATKLAVSAHKQLSGDVSELFVVQ
ncbi:hypothetical protein AB0D16_25300 [Streptomyces sp. NPDC048161]|uniref:hypothetical protein n=1 Tax=Streptomyces sp. NPDC048161 TaxID=3160985 RepID=UPI0033E8F2C5